MRVCALVVWFNPENLENPVERVQSYSSFVEKVYVIDNSSSDNSFLASKIENAVYIPLMKNTGIAHALNVGSKKAIDDGFEWCLTMDQDSVWEKEEIGKYLKIAEENKNEYQNFSPTIRTKIYPSLLGNIKRKFLHRTLEPFFYSVQYYDRWITSGSLMSLSAWAKVPIKNYSGGGEGFNEKFFIDEVDFEYCVRFVQAGFKCRFCPEVYLNHTLGNYKEKETFFPQWNAHSDFRLYYIVRNTTYMMQVYPEYTKKYKYKKSLRKRIFSRLFKVESPKNFFAAFRLIKEARQDAKKI